jgi:hypothetical protein
MKEKLMKKWLGFGRLPVMALALGFLFAACDQAQKVDVVFSKANEVNLVTAVKTTDSKYVIVGWTAAENVGNYSLFVQQEGKKTQQLGYSFGLYSEDGNKYKYSADGTLTENDDLDSWSVRGSVERLDYSQGEPKTVPYYTTGKKYRFGVQTTELVPTTANPVPSDIKWSEYVQF